MIMVVGFISLRKGGISQSLKSISTNYHSVSFCPLYLFIQTYLLFLFLFFSASINVYLTLKKLRREDNAAVFIIYIFLCTYVFSSLVRMKNIRYRVAITQSVIIIIIIYNFFFSNSKHFYQQTAGHQTFTLC